MATLIPNDAKPRKRTTVTEDIPDGLGNGLELALPGDTIRLRHIATRASNRRRIIVLTTTDAEFEGYSIGLDDHSLQLLELPSGEVSSIALDYIVSISDGKLFTELSREEKDIVDRRTASFRKTSQSWLVSNWPGVYEDRSSHYRDRTHRERQSTSSSKPVPAEYQASLEYLDREGKEYQ